MAVINGTPGTDNITGTPDDDTIHLGDGNDWANGGRGNDTIYGEGGNDRLASGFGSDSLYGGDGDDELSAETQAYEPGANLLLDGGEGDDRIIADLRNSSTLEVFGGAGSDYINVYGYNFSASIDGGAGDDYFYVQFDASNSFTVSLGDGVDTVFLRPQSWLDFDADVVITDFATGTLGDTVDLTGIAWETNWDGISNPFADGYLTLVQVGADAVLMADPYLNGSSYTVATFQNTQVTDFTFNNFGHMVDGSAPPTQYWTGTAGNDFHYGTNYDDDMSGLEGDDTLYGQSGNDILRGQDGDDTLYGEDGDDILFGGAGADILQSGYGSDLLFGGGGNDSINVTAAYGAVSTGNGEWGNDSLFADGVDATVHLNGGGGNDSFRVFGTNNITTVDGGIGDDRVSIATSYSATTVTLGEGFDTLSFESSYVSDVDNCVTVTDFAVGAGGDFVEVYYFLYYGSNNWDPTSDPFGSGHLSLVQVGSDTHLQYFSQGGETGSAQTLAIFQDLSVGDFTFENFNYRPDGSPTPGDTWVGTGADEYYEGTGGNDDLSGLGGDDTLVGLAGDDRLLGGAGDDELNGGTDADRLFGGSGHDWLYSYAGDDTLFGEGGNDLFSIRSNSQDPVRSVTAFGGSGSDEFYATLDNDGSVTLNGGSGNDTYWLEGQGGLIMADGGDDADEFSLSLQGSRAILSLGAGQDTVNIGELDWYDFENQVTITDFETGASGDIFDFSGFLSIEFVDWNGTDNPFALGYIRLVQVGADSHLQVGTTYNNTFVTAVIFQNTTVADFAYQNFNGWTVDGSEVPGETWVGTEGDDNYTSTQFADDLTALGGDDIIRGGIGSDIIRGGAGNDTLYGEDGNDILFGGDGADVLHVGGGNSTAYGGGGNDLLTLQYLDIGQIVDADVTLDGGWGHDRFEVSVVYGVTANLLGQGGNDTFLIDGDGGYITLDAGAGDDTVEILPGVNVDVTLGEGADTVSLASDFYPGGGVVRIADFDTGPGGDFFDFSGRLGDLQELWDGVSNPFRYDLMRLVQVGNDVELRYTQPYLGEYSVLAVFENKQVADFTAEHFGFDPNGEYPEGVTWEGTSGNDSYTGTGGSDLLNGHAGADTLIGLDGDDRIFGEAGNDYIEGGDGADLLFGGGGNDVISDSGRGFGRHYIDAGAGHDDVTVNLYGSQTSERYTVLLGDGDDALEVYNSNASLNFIYGGGGADDISYTGREGLAFINGGGGDDNIFIAFFGAAYTLTLGAGSDTVEIARVSSAYTQDREQLVITDFETGPQGDHLILENLLPSFSQSWSNPFANRTARLVQRGDDAWLQTSTSPDGFFSTVAVLQNVDIANFIGDSEFGFDPGTRSFYGTDLGDNLTGMWGDNRMYGYAGNDIMDGRAGDDLVDGGNGNDVLYGRNGNDELIGGDGDDALFGAAGDDRLIGGIGTDKLYADIGNDYLDGGAGDDEMGGGAGHDTMFGGRGNDLLRGKSGDDVMDGGAGNDTLLGGYNNDTLDGGAGDDYLAGEAGDDTLAGGLGIDKLLGSFGADTLYGDEGDDQLFGEGGDDIIHGGADNDLIVGASGSDLLYGDAGADTMRGGADDDTMYGGDGWDIMYGDDGWDSMDGGAGNDRMFGGLNADVMNGGADNDYLEGQDGDDVMGGGDGDDVMHGGDGNDQVAGSTGNDELFGGAGFDVLDGGAGNDVLEGGADDDLLIGGDGDDMMRGGNGFDDMFGGNGADTLYGELGADLLAGGAGNDILEGGDGDDLLFGEAGSDTIRGGNGVDVISGGLGADTLTGGTDIDVFVFDSALGGGNVDTITDFVAGTDGIVLDLNIFGAIGNEGVLDSGAFRNGSSAGDSNDRIIYNSSTGEIFYDADGSGSGAKILFAKVTPGTNLSASSFEAYFLQTASEPAEKLGATPPPPEWHLHGADQIIV